MRVDAGFVSGDEVTSYYDPMIAKLIVQGPNRKTAIRKLNAALSEYQIAGPLTNVEFLKKICQIPAFIAGEVETGFIQRWHKDLFYDVEIRPETFAQAALGAYFTEVIETHGRVVPFSGAKSGFPSASQKRSFQLASIPGDGSRQPTSTTVEIEQTGHGLFTVLVNGSSFDSVASQYDAYTRTIVSYFPHTRFETRFIKDEGDITLFQQGQQYRLRCITPTWIEKALGIKDMAHSVVAPMPCKILRVEVEAGQQVKKEQVLVVIESMKMETSIRSPQDGVVSKIVHQQGVSCNVLDRMCELTPSIGTVQSRDCVG